MIKGANKKAHIFNDGKVLKIRDLFLNGVEPVRDNLYFRKNKNGQATSIAPLQLSTLASFPPWGSSKGADRRRLAHCKCKKSTSFLKYIFAIVHQVNADKT
jgi:hypothetical protein